MTLSKSSWACPQCKKMILRRNLYAHLRNVHFYTSEEVQKVRDEINREAPAQKDYVFCPLCEERLENHERLAKHCEEKHAEEGAGGEPQDYSVFMLILANKEEFEAWLEEHQQHSGTTFYTRDSSKSSGTLSLRCNRAGKYSKKTQTRATHTKRDVLHCSCFLNVKFEDDGSVKLKGCLGHVGHKVDSALLRLTPTQQLFLKELLEEFSHDEIIKRLRRDYPAETSRLHFVNKGDLWSISNRFGLKPVYCSSDDMPPVNEGTEENNTDDGIRLLEMPGNPSGERFRLIIIAPEQVECLQKFSHKGIFIKSAHSSTRCNLKRVTVMVSNEQDDDIPAAFLLCESMTSLDVEEFFREIRKVVPEFDPKQIHTDDASCFYNAFRSVFPKSSAKLTAADGTLQK